MHAQLVWGGDWTEQVLAEEIWVNSIRFQGDWLPDSQWNDLLDEMKAKVATYHAKAVHSHMCRLKWVKLNQINAEGKYAQSWKTFERDYTPPVVGTGTAGLLPLQNTVAVTFHTARQRGIGSRGRMFMPGVRVPEIATTGILAPADATARRQAVAEFIGTLRVNNQGWTGVPAVVSKGAANGAGDGLAAPITAVSVGRIVDTQRRRRNKLRENYEPLAVV
jgi:hypothetical protein